MSTERGLDYEHELGNGWSRYEKMVLAEMKRLADQGEKTAVLLQAHEIHFAALAEQNRQRDEVLKNIVDEMTDLRSDHDDLSRKSASSKLRFTFTKKVATIAIAVIAWCATTGLSVYSIFFHGNAAPR